MEFYEASGPDVSTTIIPDDDWDFVDTSVTLRATDLSNVQPVKITYKGLTGTMKFNVVQLLSINGMVTDSYKPKLYPGASHEVDVNHFRTSRAGSGIEKVEYNPGIPVKVGEITDGSGNPISDSVFYNKQMFKSTVSGASFSDHLEMTVGVEVPGYKAKRELDILLTWSDVRIGYFNHTAAYAYYVAKYGTDESHVDTYWDKLKDYCSYLEDVEDTFREGEEHANKRAWILGVGEDSKWASRPRDDDRYEIIGATKPDGPINSQIAKGDVVTFYSNVAGMALASNGDTGLQTVTTFAEGGTSQVPQSSVISSFLTYRATSVTGATIGFNFHDNGNDSVVNYFNDGGSVSGLSVKQALCPMAKGTTLRNSSYNFVTGNGISQTYNDQPGATTLWTTDGNRKVDNRWCVDYVTNGNTPLEITNGNNVSWKVTSTGERRTFSSAKGTEMTVTGDSSCITPGDSSSTGSSLNMTLGAALKMDDKGTTFTGGNQGFRLLQASFDEFGGRYTDVYTIYNWYPSVVVKANVYEEEEGHVAQPGEPYIVNVSQADADVTVNCNDPSIRDVMWEDASNEAFSFGSWNTGSPIIWAKNATVTTKMEQDENGDWVTEYPNASLSFSATRKRVADTSTASVNFEDKSTKLYTYKWYNGSGWDDSLRDDRECNKGTKADISKGETKDVNRIAVGDYVMNADNYKNSSLNKMTIKLYKAGSNSSNAPKKVPSGEPLATAENGKQKPRKDGRIFFAFDGGALHINENELKTTQVYTLTVKGEQGSCVVNGETFNWGAPTVVYYVYNLYSDSFANKIAGTGVTEKDGKQVVSIDDKTEIYIQSYFSAVYSAGNFSPEEAFVFQNIDSNGRLIVNAKNRGTKDSNKENSEEDKEEDFFRVYVKPSAVTYDGTDVKIKVVHPEFAGRTKSNTLTLYRKLNEKINIVERHKGTVDLDLPNGCQISNKENAKFDDGLVQTQGTSYEQNDKGTLLKHKSDITEEETRSNSSNATVRQAKIKSGDLEIIARTYNPEKPGPAKIYIYNKDKVCLGSVTVKTLPFKAATFVRLMDNVGYGKLDSKKEKSVTLGEYIYIENGKNGNNKSKVWAGDDIYVISNSASDVETTGRIKGNSSLVLGNCSLDRDSGDLKKVKSSNMFYLLRNNYVSDKSSTLKLSAGETEYAAEKFTVDVDITPGQYWKFYDDIQGCTFTFTTKDTGTAKVYKDKGMCNEASCEVDYDITPSFGIANNAWQVNPSEAINKFTHTTLGSVIWGKQKLDGWYGSDNSKFPDLQFYKLIADNWEWKKSPGGGANTGYSSNPNYTPLHTCLKLYTRESTSARIGGKAVERAKSDFAKSLRGYTYTPNNQILVKDKDGWDHYYPTDNAYTTSSVTGNLTSGWYNALTSMTFLNTNGERTMQANKYGTVGATNWGETTTSEYMAMSPLVNNEAVKNGKDFRKLTNLQWSGSGVKNNLVTTGGVKNFNNFTNDRYCVKMHAGPLVAGENTPYVNEQAIAQFKTTKDKANHEYIYFGTSTHAVMVTYQITRTSGKEPWQIIKRDRTSSNPDKQHTVLYSSGSTLLKAVTYDKAKSDNGDDTLAPNKTSFSAKSNVFGNPVLLDFRENTSPSYAGRFSGPTEEDSVLWYGTLSELFGTTMANGTGDYKFSEWGTTDWQSWSDDSHETRIDATALGWTDSDVKYVDVNFTYILPRTLGCRQITFPVRLIK